MSEKESRIGVLSYGNFMNFHMGFWSDSDLTSTQKNPSILSIYRVFQWVNLGSFSSEMELWNWIFL